MTGIIKWQDYSGNETIIGDRYRIVREIGRGGMGTVYLAEDVKLANKLRAIKVLTPVTHQYSMLGEEAQLMMKINHPHLPLILDYFAGNEIGFEALVMEYIEGYTLAELYRDHKASFTFAEIIKLAIQLCSALIHLHSYEPPIIHRDLKPSNVMIDKKWDIKLIDFGISRQYKKGQLQDTVQLGTHGFAAPEQTEGGQSDERTDVYGLGALLFFLASGGASYQRPERKRGEMEPFKLLQDDVPEAFKMILLRLLQPEPRFRYSSVKEVEEALIPFAQPKLLINQREDQQRKTSKSLNKSLNKSIRACLLSLSPGAGATFLAHSLADLLGKRGVPITAAEYSFSRPEWHAWFPPQERNNNDQTSRGVSSDERYISHQKEGQMVRWMYVDPEQPLHKTNQEDQLFEHMLRHAGGVIQLIDLSSEWRENSSLMLLKESDFVFIVADPAASKWQSNDLRQLFAIKQQLQVSGGQMKFIANKDISFRGRADWMSLFPEQPHVIMPRLAEDKLLSLHYAGRWATDDSRMRKRLNQAFQPIFKLFYNEINTD